MNYSNTMYHCDREIGTLLGQYFKKWWHPNVNKVRKIQGWLLKLKNGDDTAFAFLNTKAGISINVVQRAGVVSCRVRHPDVSGVLFIREPDELIPILDKMYERVFDTGYQVRRIPKPFLVSQGSLDLRFPA